MVVLQIIKPLGMGGVERIACDLNNFLNDNNINSFIAVNKTVIKTFINHFKIIKIESIIPYEDDNYLIMVLSIKRIINKIKPDIVHTHARQECFIASILRKNYIHIRTQHMEEKPSIPVTKFEKLLLKFEVNKWVATSNKLKKDYLLPLGFIDNKKIAVIYNGVNCSELKYNFQNKLKKFCIISRLSFQKGIDILINEIASFPSNLREKIYIDIYGEGDQLEVILELIKSLRLDNQIIYKGTTNKPQDIVYKYLALLMPSRTEGLPLTMLESMASYTPVAIHNVGCISEFIVNNHNGWIIDNDYTWKNFFKEILGTNYNYEKIIYNAYKTFKNQFFLKRMCFDYFNLYNEVFYKTK